MGTSLQVAPVSLIPDMVSCNRVLFNRDMVMRIRKGSDIFVAGDCDTNVQTLSDLLGWGDALRATHIKHSIHSRENAEEAIDICSGEEEVPRTSQDEESSSNTESKVITVRRNGDPPNGNDEERE